MVRLWIAFVLVTVLSFAVLGWVGTRIYQEAPPLADRVVADDGTVVVESGDILVGQNVWQSMGGMELGSIWGHGSYVAPDWTADWLHRECVFILDAWAQEGLQRPYDRLAQEQQMQLQGRLQSLMRANRYDPATNAITIDPLRARAFEANVLHYAEIFSQGHEAYAIPEGAMTDPEKLRALAAFFFWTAWAASTDRPGDTVSYTQNWPHEPLVGNRPTGETVVWTGVSVIMLLAGISAFVWFYASRGYRQEEGERAVSDPLVGWQPTPSQQATVKYFWVVAAMILVQIMLGVVTAHYGVEGNGFYGIPLAKWLPYSVARTWHLQLGILWIATAWLGAGLFIGPLVSGREPAGQRLGVNLLFVALVTVVAGSLAGQWLSIHGKLSLAQSFYLGHQGYEYVDLGRVWQIALFAGLVLWLLLVVRSIAPALRQPGEQKQLLALFLVSTAAIALFYAAGLAWGRHTNLSIVEYWRWWVVHLWVEGFFEVFATTVIAFFFYRLSFIRAKLAAEATLLSATIYLSGGIIGTLHHLYFAGTPTVALAWGSVFSALEVVPLVLVAYAALEDLRIGRGRDWIRSYRWPIYFFVAVAFWNMVGAGLFGFMINPPIALYFMQGLNTTPVHGHAALFGVYGMLGIGLMLFCLRTLRPGVPWKEGLVAFSFWAMNIGLFAMVVGSLLPLGLMQTWASVDHGYWFARSAEFLESPGLRTLRWMRIPGDTLFAFGAVALVIFILGLKTGASFRRVGADRAGP
ncbi:MAG: nitric-oxide reductase large subunit [Planctomycetia bacterium]|nr:nitric-oxide reductase large subunit [Planctomycetia bacterium]